MFKKISLISIMSLVTVLPMYAQPLETTKTVDEISQQHLMDDVQRFSYALSLIKQYYVTTTNDSKLFDHAIQGMLIALDPHSSYLDEADFKELQRKKAQLK